MLISPNMSRHFHCSFVLWLLMTNTENTPAENSSVSTHSGREERFSVPLLWIRIRGSSGWKVAYGTTLIEPLNAISSSISVLVIILTGKINASARLVFHSAHEKSHCNPGLCFLCPIFFLHSPSMVIPWCPHVAFLKAMPKHSSLFLVIPMVGQL